MSIFEKFSQNIPQYPKITIDEERHLIAKAKKGSSNELDELVCVMTLVKQDIFCVDRVLC